jgi:hypothetical protein
VTALAETVLAETVLAEAGAAAVVATAASTASAVQPPAYRARPPRVPGRNRALPGCPERDCLSRDAM